MIFAGKIILLDFEPDDFKLKITNAVLFKNIFLTLLNLGFVTLPVRAYQNYSNQSATSNNRVKIVTSPIDI